MSTPNPDAVDPRAAAAPIENGTIVAERDVTLTVDDHRTVDVFAGTVVPAVLVDAYRTQVLTEDSAEAPKRGRGKPVA